MAWPPSSPISAAILPALVRPHNVVGRLGKGKRVGMLRDDVIPDGIDNGPGVLGRFVLLGISARHVGREKLGANVPGLQARNIGAALRSGFPMSKPFTVFIATSLCVSMISADRWTRIDLGIGELPGLRAQRTRQERR